MSRAKAASEYLTAKLKIAGLIKTGSPWGLSIDPGTKVMACALWKGEALKAVKLIKASRDIEYRVADWLVEQGVENLGWLCIESQVIRDQARAHSVLNLATATVKLATVIRERFHPEVIATPIPEIWKGTASKASTEKWALKHLTILEINVMFSSLPEGGEKTWAERTDAQRKTVSDFWDGIALGLNVMGRW